MGMRTKLAVAGIGLVGFGLLVLGTALIYPPAALVVAGIGLLALAWLALSAVVTQ